MGRFIYLASQSPRRAQLLSQIGIEHKLLLPLNDENIESLEQVLPHETADAYVQRVTLLKLEAAVLRLARLKWLEAPILCADTTVSIDNQILGKPLDPPHAATMLQQLSGREHDVLTAVAFFADGQYFRATNRSTVEFMPLSAAQIERYVQSQEPFGKAGSYAIQGAAQAWVKCIRGSYSGIMGLPLFEVASILRDMDYII